MGNHPECVKLLLKFGADPLAKKSGDDRSSLDVAIDENRSQVCGEVVSFSLPPVQPLPCRAVAAAVAAVAAAAAAAAFPMLEAQSPAVRARQIRSTCKSF